MTTTRIVLVIALATTPGLGLMAAAAQDSREVVELRKRVADLEVKVATLEEALGAATRSPDANVAVNAQRQKARERMARDVQQFTKEQLAEVETLYQVANRNPRSDAARTILTTLVDKYPGVNRTGCAVLYLGQMSEDAAERERLLRQAIDQHADSFYGDGVQVGAFARFLLSRQYAAAGRADDARRLVDELTQMYPDSIDHTGRSLLEQLR